MFAKHILIFIMLLCFSCFAYAGPTYIKDITFIFEINASLEGNWNMYFISVGEFDNSNWTFSDYENKIEQDYTHYKNNCGTNDTFYEAIYKMSDEEKKHKGCTINGTYQQEYCYQTVSDKKECEFLAEYKIDYNKQLNFKSYYDSYMWDIGKAEWYSHYEVSYCKIENKTCKFTINKISSPYNPYIVVLEKLNSNKDIYFSNKINISQTDIFYNDSLFVCETDCNVHLEKNIKLSIFEIKEPNQLNIEFEDIKQEMPKSENFFQKILSWLKNIFK